MKKIIDLKGKPEGAVYEVNDALAKLLLEKNHFSKGGRYIGWDERHRYLTEVVETKIVPEDYNVVEVQKVIESMLSARDITTYTKDMYEEAISSETTTINFPKSYEPIEEPAPDMSAEADLFEAKLKKAGAKKIYEATTGAKAYAEENNIDLSQITPKNGNKITINDLK